MTTFEGFQLSPQQQRLWRLQQGRAVFTSRCALDLRGELDAVRLEHALEEIVTRHEILRTTFWMPPLLKRPLQVIAQEGALLFTQIGRTAESGVFVEAEDGWHEMFAAPPGERALDPAHGPLLQAFLVRLGARRHCLILSLPALCADRRSLLNIAEELALAYAGEQLEPVAMQYADYAAWLNEQLEDERVAAGRAHWYDPNLAAAAEVRLPGERPVRESFDSAVYAEDWPGERWREIAAVAHVGGGNPTAWLLAVWQVLLERLTGASVTIGVLCEGREFEEVQQAVGLFARYLPTPAGARPADLCDLVARLGTSLREGREWQDYFDCDHAVSGGFFPFCFELGELPPPRSAAGLDLRVQRVSAWIDRCRLRLGCTVTSDALLVELGYDPGCYDAVDVARFGEHLRVLVGGALRAPAAPLRELPLLSPVARHQLLFAFNDTPTPDALGGVSVPERFACQVAATPQRIAVSCEERALTYAELAARAGTLAGRLRSLGVGPEVIVGLFLDRSLEMVIAVLAVLQAGGAYLPLDPQLPSERLTYMLEDAAVTLVLTEGALAATLPPGARRVVRMDEGQATVVTPAASAPLPEQLAYVIYTSGSTGRPKGTLLSHRALANYLAFSMAAYVDGGDGVPLHSPLAFDLTVTGLFVPLLTGRQVMLVSESLGLDGLADALRRGHEYSFVKLTPAHMEVLHQQLGEEVAGIRCRALVLGGEALLASHVTWWQARVPATRMFNEYGPTEAAVGCCVEELPSAVNGTAALPIGRPIGGMRLHVVDEHLEPVPVAAVGELVIGGPGLARGYLGQPVLTAERFVPDPHARTGGERLYRTGDLACYRYDGKLEFLGRRDHQVKLRGYRIELGEIEAALRKHPAVREVVVIVDEAQAGHSRLCACWSGVPADSGDLAAWLERQLPSYMVPPVFVGLETLPLTPNGKVDRSALRELVRRRAGAWRHPYRAPRTETEKILAEIWAELLSADRIGLDDNFFQLGGDSIVSLQLLGRASRRGLRLTTRQVFSHPTLLEQAAAATKASVPSTEQGLVVGPVPLIPIQQAFFATPDPEPHHYDFAVLQFRIEHPLDSSRLAAAVDALWSHHDALRLRFRQVDGIWRQDNAGLDGRGPYVVLDLKALPAAARETELAAAATRLATAFDLAAGPLARFVLIRLSATDRPAGSLLLLLHHLVTDAVSCRILLEDLETVCRQAAAGASFRLPAKSTSFRRWAECLCEYADSAELQGELDYWLAPERRKAVHLPLDGVPRHRTVAWSAECRQELDAESTQALLQEVPRAYHTEINDVLLAALSLALTRLAGGPVLVDIEGHGREELFADVDLSRTIGWFTSLYPVLLDPSPAAVEPGEVLIGVKEKLRRLPGRGVGYGLLRYLCSESTVQQALAGMPAAEVTFNYLGQLDAGGRPTADRFFTPSEPLEIAPQGLHRRRPYLLEINAHVDSGCLQVEWRYDREAHRRTTIEELGRRFLADLRSLIVHCRSRATSTYTPADFPLTRLDSSQLDRLIASHGEVADLYPLAPMQQSMLLHTLTFPTSDVGFDQTVFWFRGVVDVEALRQAWQRLCERHAVLRTCFSWQSADSALQVVKRKVETPWVELDLTTLQEDERRAAYRQLLVADRRRGFQLARAPLSRLLLVRLGGGESRLVWSHHHVLLDGWSTALVVSELAALYRALCSGAELELPRCHSYRDYIAWLSRHDSAHTEAYWRQLLAGFTAPTPLIIERSELLRRAPVPCWVVRRLPAALGLDLRQSAGRYSITPNVLLQAAWASLLCRYSSEPDVVFGSTVAGRPADLAGVETIVGLFIKNLPVRVRFAPGASMLLLFRAMQRQQIEQRDHEAAAPADVQPWSDVPGFLPLFESLVVVANYPFVDPSSETFGIGGTEEAGIPPVLTAYPLTLLADLAEQPVLGLVYDDTRFERTAMQRLQGHLEILLCGIAENADRPVQGLPLLTTGERHQLLEEWGWVGSDEQWLVLDDCRQPVPLGVVGEIHHARPGDALVGTGEAATHRTDGGVELLGRREGLVRIQGRSVDLRRLEEVLAAHPAVSGAAAVVRGDSTSRGGMRLVAYIESAGAATPGLGELHSFLRQRWSAGAQPADLVFLSSLPRCQNGSVDYAGLPSPEAQRLETELNKELLGVEGDVVEIQLLRLWEDVLGMRPIGRDDDFFALGGTSISALRLASRLRQELGRDLPLAVFLRAATVRGLATQLQIAMEGTAWSPLVAIRPAGVKRPFFCVHPVGGNVLCFVNLARRLDPERPFFGLQAAGLGGGQKPHSRLAEMAAHYLEEIRRVQARGPYLLGGLSFGGYVAFEMAQQLRSRGEEVALLALLDTASPFYRGESTLPLDAAATLSFQAGFMAEAAGVDIEIEAGELRRLDDAAQLDLVVKRLLGTAPAVRDLGQEHLRRVLALYQNHAFCLASYQPRPYQGRLTVFRAREEHQVLEAMLQHPAQHEPDYGWGELGLEPVEVRWVPGNHSTMIHEPHVISLAAELDTALAAADSILAPAIVVAP